eukprot:TRINITY_DN36407_c0_g1_i1.p1 TRINITY_DN36407_c0_g1~~TRINITY_DN36407_c0_g1_i1.p1  ORF type:complete len:357 (+),score=68.87 TRINITY_DN36407_c0_g1_i1:143-1213(+)
MSGKAAGKGGPPPPKPAGQKLSTSGGYLAKAAAKAVTVAAAAPAPESMEAPLTLECPPSTRFEVGDPAAMQYLEEHGYVVFGSVAGAQQLQEAEKLLFDFMEEHAGWKRDDPDSWSDEGLGQVSANGIANGIINKRGAGHADVAWYVRTLPAVRKIFEDVWNDADLLVSFDAFGLFRPWHTGKYFRTLGGWFHVDQGVPGKQCIQGLLSMYDQNAHTGGLTVIPGTHHRFEEHTRPEPFQDYIEVERGHSLHRGPYRLVDMRAGDFVLWDSRTVHCNSPAIETPVAPGDRLLRAVVYVCMTPRCLATAETLEMRIKSYDSSMTTSHWPHKSPIGFGFKKDPPNDYATAPAERKALI